MHDSDSDNGTLLRQVPQWMRAYAANRTLGVIVNLCIFLLDYLAIAGTSVLVAWAWRKGNMPLLVLGAVLLAALLGFTVWMSMPAGWRRLHEVAIALEQADGVTHPPTGVPRVPRWLLAVLVVGLLTGIFAETALGMAGLLPERLFQPASALLLVPFLVVLSCAISGSSFSFGYLWAALYGLHALLLWLGAPIYIGGQWTFLNMLVPIAGYGLLAALVGHVYGRVMLNRVKLASQATLAEGGGEA